MLGKIKNSLKTILKIFHIEITRTNKRPTVFFETDNEFHDLYLLALKKTQLLSSDNSLKRKRNYTLIQSLKQALAIIDNGNVAECGCWRGSSTYQIAYWLKKYNFRNKFFLFDSFEGLSNFQKEDLENNKIVDQQKRQKEFACPLDTVQENLKEFDFIAYKKGWIPDRFNEISDLMFSFVHIDVDLYQPIKDSLEFFYPRMIGSGIIVLDDYGYLSFPGAKRAIDEFIKDKNDFFLHLPFGSAFLMKNKGA